MSLFRRNHYRITVIFLFSVIHPSFTRKKWFVITTKINLWYRYMPKRSFNVLVGMQALSHLQTTTWNGINDSFWWTPRKRIRAPITSLPHDINLFPSIIQTTGGTPRPSFRHSAIRFCFITFRLCYWSCQVKHREGAQHVPLFHSQQLVATRKWLTILFAFFWAKCTAIRQNKWEQPRCIYLCIFAWPKSSGFTDG